MPSNRISSLLNLSSMSFSSNNSNTVNNNPGSPDQSMAAKEAKRSPGQRNFSRLVGDSSHGGSFSGSYPSSPSVAATATVSPSTSQQQQHTPLSERGDFTQSPLPIEEEVNGQRSGPPSSRWGRLNKPSSRPASRSNSPKPGPSADTANELSPDISADGQRRRNGRGWLRSRSRSRSRSNIKAGPTAWIVGLEKRVEYNVTPMLNADKVRSIDHISVHVFSHFWRMKSLDEIQVPELWNPEGDTFIYLYPKNSGCKPSFRIESSVYSSSALLTRLAHGSLYTNPANPVTRRRRKTTLEGEGSTVRNVSQGSPVLHGDSESSGSSRGSRVLSEVSEPSNQEIHLYLPIDPEITSPQDANRPLRIVETFVKVRNLFAFLLGQSLVATVRASDTYSIFLGISEMLQMYDFSNLDGSTYGEVANTSFEEYVEELHMTDVRASAEKTVEAIVIAEKMRSTLLYNEAFVHAVGKHDDIKKLGSSKFDMISPLTRNRMERATMDLYMRLKNVHARLNEFEFPDLFSGVMNSRTAEERKIVRFDEWKSSFMATRRAVLAYYKKKYGSWPPKASSKKNDLLTSGLNRLVLIELYNDFSALYDVLVDRNKLTTRSLDITVEDDDPDDPDEMITRAMRRVLSEYDNSMPPVQPPVPFDCPMLPSHNSVRKPSIAVGSAEDKKSLGKKLKDEKLQIALRASHNKDALPAQGTNGNGNGNGKSSPTSFLQFFLAFEHSAGRNKTIDELSDLRSGQWLFMYAVLQSLPLLVVDAPALHYTEGVEYFLCQPSRHGTSWARGDDAGPRMHWYGVTGSNGVVSMPADVVEYGVEGIYRRSHCWKVAEQWIEALHPPSADQESQLKEPEPEPEPEPESEPYFQPDLQQQQQQQPLWPGQTGFQPVQYPPGPYSSVQPPQMQAAFMHQQMMTPPLTTTNSMVYPHQQNMQKALPTPPASTSTTSMTYPPIQSYPHPSQYVYPQGPPQPWLSSHPSSPHFRVDSPSQSPVTVPKMEVEDTDPCSPELPIMHPGSPDQSQQPQQQQQLQHFLSSSAASSPFPTASSTHFAQSPVALPAGQSPQLQPYQLSPNVNCNNYPGQYAQASYPFPQRSPSPQVLVTPSVVSSNSRSDSPDSSTVSLTAPGTAPYQRQHQHSNSLGVSSTSQLYPSRSLGVNSGGVRSKRQSVMDRGLEALPLPAGVMPAAATGGGGAVKPLRVITKNPSITFDAIIGDGEGKGNGEASASLAKRPGTVRPTTGSNGQSGTTKLEKKKKGK